MRSESSSHGLDEFLAEVPNLESPWNIHESRHIRNAWHTCEQTAWATAQKELIWQLIYLSYVCHLVT
jgi:hypothetical protein